MHKELHYRLLALLMTVVTIFQFVIITPSAVFAESTEANAVTEEVSANAEPKEAAVAEVPVLKAAAIPKPSSTVLCFTSDTHNKSGNVAAGRLGTWLDMVNSKYGGVTLMAFGGDMANASASQSDFWTLTQADMNQLDDRSVTGVYTTGNHEYNPGSYTNGKNDTTKRYVEDAQGAEGSNYRIYCLGSAGSSWNAYSSAQATTLQNYLNSVGNDKVIIVITHYPLHYNASRLISGAESIIDVLNNAVASGKKIVYLWGHNHTDSDKNYDQIFVPGDEITYASNSKKKVQFYYGAAGCMSDSEYGSGSAYVKGKGLVLTIDSSNKLAFTYYDENGNNVTEGGTVMEGDPIAVTGVTISKTSASVKERETVQLTATVSPSDATNKAVTWSSSNTGVATVSTTGLVRGVSEGTATITVTTVDGNFSAYCTVTVTHNDNPSVEETIDITPSTSNPEQSLSINVGDTLVINVENGSSNSAYDYSITLSNSSVAKVNGNSTVNIAAGATGQFTVEGIADGNVDITIKNNQSSSSYVRKATIHLTVGAGGTTPVGDTVNITPSTDNPEESIRINVNDTLTVNVTNGSSNSAYDFTATLSNSGIAQIQGNSTVNIAAGAIGQFVVKGLSEGTVEITIQNENSYGSQYVRKGVIHLTVGSGTTPVDPPSGDTVTYRLATTMEAGKEYIIANGNSGSVYVLSNESGGSKQLKGISATVSDSTITLSAANAAKAVFSVTANSNSSQSGMWLTNGSQYLYADSSDGLRLVASSTQTSSSNSAKSWHYRSDRNLLWFFKDTSSSNGYTDTSQTYKYFLKVSSGNFTDDHVSTTSLENSTIPAMYLYAKDDTPANVSGVNLDKTSLNMKVGRTATLTATVLPGNAQNKNVTWTSSNPAAATVNNGVVTAVAVGSTVITVTTEEGGFTATCQVTVSNASGTTYVLTDKLEDGKNYLIANGNTGSVYILSNEAGGSRELKGVSVEVVGDTITIDDDDISKVTFSSVKNSNSSQSGVWLMNGSQYLYADSSDGLRLVASSTQTSSSNNAKSWHYKADNKNILWFFKDTSSSDGYTDTSQTYKYFLKVSSGNFTDDHVSTTSLGNTTTPAMYLFVEDNGTAPHTHTYGQPTWNWAADHKSATATFTCTAGDDTQTVTDNAPAEAVVSAATCAADKVVKYTATVTFNGTQYTATSENVTVAGTATGHTYGQPTWSWAEDYKSATATFTCTSGDDTKTVKDNAPVETIVSAATCTADKVAKYTAKVTFNGTEYTVTADNVAVPNTATGHNWGRPTYTWANDYSSVTASCTCRNDSSHVETETVATVTEITTAATCTTKGETTYTANFSSSAFSTQTMTIDDVPALGHDYVWRVTKEATCTAKGQETGTCSRCGDEQTREIEALGHAMEHYEAQTATCTTSGWKAYDECARCGYSTYESIPALGHSMVHHNAKAATCTEVGWAEYDECSRCDYTTYKEIEALGHDLIHHDAKAATCEEVGWEAYDTCSRCDHTTYVEIAATGHNWGRPTYTWADDMSSVTAKSVCSKNATHIKEETVATTCEIIKEATIEEEGEKKYTAVFKDELFEVQTMTVTIPKESVYPISFEKFANTTKGINVAWNAVEDPALKEYALYRSEAGKNQWKLVAEGLTATKYTDSDTTLKSGELYDYKLVVTKNSGSKYDAVRSNWRYVGATVMNAPTCTRAGIRVTWPKVEGAAKYEIYRSIGAGTPHWELLTTVDATDADLQVYNHTNIEEPGTWYAYTVRAIHEDGTYGGQPGGRSILFRAPVKVVKAESISSGVRVTFTTVAAGYTYRLYRCTKVNGKWSEPEQITDLVKTYTGNPQNVWIYDKTAQNGQTYKYYVRCVSKDGAVPLSSYENEIQITYKKP